MNLFLQYQINQDPLKKQYLRENSYWYKYLNRSDNYYKEFINGLKEKYKLTPSDKINKINDNLEMVRTFLEVLK